MYVFAGQQAMNGPVIRRSTLYVLEGRKHGRACPTDAHGIYVGFPPIADAGVQCDVALMDEQQAEQVLAMIASAIQTANLDYPKMADGTQWDQRVKSNEESRHLTHAVLERLWANGYEIRRRSNA